ncbi:hypothetical protein G3M48_007879 [Beauveria asiatica]|uniref:Uncharacterized protein n=1 Tax=Beauveria asiatica TaxID=1069075 RepID=A0AAW0RMC0_9HYPO
MCAAALTKVARFTRCCIFGQFGDFLISFNPVRMSLFCRMNSSSNAGSSVALGHTVWNRTCPILLASLTELRASDCCRTLLAALGETFGAPGPNGHKDEGSRLPTSSRPDQVLEPDEPKPLQHFGVEDKCRTGVEEDWLLVRPRPSIAMVPPRWPGALKCTAGLFGRGPAALPHHASTVHRADATGRRPLAPLPDRLRVQLINVEESLPCMGRPVPAVQQGARQHGRLAYAVLQCYDYREL